MKRRSHTSSFGPHTASATASKAPDPHKRADLKSYTTPYIYTLSLPIVSFARLSLTRQYYILRQKNNNKKTRKKHKKSREFTTRPGRKGVVFIN